MPESNVSAIVCVPTFRRPAHLEKTLASLARQSDEVNFAVVVVENDSEGREGEAVADAFLKSGTLRGLCVVESRQGNCRAINRAFETALAKFPSAEFILMIDDDEIASSSWLAEMVGAARQSNADIVGGPVVRSFATTPDRAVALHPVFDPGRSFSRFIPSLLGSGNCLIRRHVFESFDTPYFDIRFNFLGGGDMDFFKRCRLEGFTTYWSDEAVVTETVPAQRMEARWILRRGLAIGAINYQIDRKRYSAPLGGSLILVKNLLTLPLSALRAVSMFRRTRCWLPTVHPICVSLGRNLAAFGYSPIPYMRRNKPNAMSPASASALQPR
jgi:GT2 family glycosyltransferase